MCGASVEAILLTAAYENADKEKVLKEYLAAGGRRKVENRMFGKASNYIRQSYPKYMDLLNYWCDSSAHGHVAVIGTNEAYEALASLLRFCHFMKDNWDELTFQSHNNKVRI